MTFIPDLLTFSDGLAVTADDAEDRRAELVDILSRYAYGYFPPKPHRLTGSMEDTGDRTCCGHALEKDVQIIFDTPRGKYFFPVNYFEPVGEGRHPLIVCINFRPDRYDKYVPVEEVIDRGFALAVVYYEDITSDDGDFTDGLAGMFDRPKDGSGYGKITLWAYGVSRVIDYFSTLDNIDPDEIAVIGHSRLGKTALWCAANDKRVKYVCSNDSGCMGAAYHRTHHEGGETLAFMTREIPYWFCENLFPFADKIDKMPFDQHMLIAASAPRYVCVNSATLDAWADPYSEQLACVGASPLWTMFGREGFAGPEAPAKTGDRFTEGSVAYCLRDGEHYLGRADWNNFMDFIIAKREG